jgi:hypothetical protein
MRSLAEQNRRHLSAVADAVIEALASIAKMAGLDGVVACYSEPLRNGR